MTSKTDVIVTGLGISPDLPMISEEISMEEIKKAKTKVLDLPHLEGKSITFAIPQISIGLKVCSAVTDRATREVVGKTVAIIAEKGSKQAFFYSSNGTASAFCPVAVEDVTDNTAIVVDVDKIQKILNYLEGFVRFSIKDTSLDVYYSGGCVSIPLYSFGVEENQRFSPKEKLELHSGVVPGSFIDALSYMKIFLSTARPEDAMLFSKAGEFTVNAQIRVGKCFVAPEVPDCVLYLSEVENLLKYLRSVDRDRIYLIKRDSLIYFASADGSYFVCSSMKNEYPVDLDKSLMVDEVMCLHGIDCASILKSIDLLSIGLEDDHPNLRLVQRESGIALEAHSRSGSISHDTIPMVAAQVLKKEQQKEIQEALKNGIIFDYKKVREIIKSFQTPTLHWGIQSISSMFTQFVLYEAEINKKAARIAYIMTKVK